MNDIMMRTLRGERTERRPLWLMRQAGRVLPEYRKLRERHTFLDLCGNPELAAEVTLMPLRRFPFDAAIVFADLMTPVLALGVEVDFAPGPVVASPLTSAARVDALRAPAREAIAPTLMETLRIVRRELAGGVPVLGFAGGPWSIAAYLVEGRGRRGFPTLRAMAASDPALLNRLLGRLTELCGEYLLAQVQAGAAAVQIFETWSGLLGLADWERLVKPHLRALLERVGTSGAARLLYLNHAAHLVDSASELPAEGLSVDWRVDLPRLRARLEPERVLQGNIDPAILLGGRVPTAGAAQRLLAAMPPRGHVVNLGHGLLPDTPLESIAAVVEAVHGEAAAQQRCVGEREEVADAR